MQSFDAIVLGLGGVGSAALAHLARRGARVLGIDRYAPPHEQGSSHGHLRVIRMAYYEHPDYVPLLRRAYELWHELEADAGQSLYREAGLLQIGPPEGEVIRGIQQSAQDHELPIDRLDADELRSRWPQFHVDDPLVGLFERQAGYLFVEECIRAHLKLAQQAGAEIRLGSEVTAWQPNGQGVSVECGGQRILADRLVIAAGAWSTRVLADLGISLAVTRQPQFWYAARDNAYHVDHGSPCFLMELPSNIIYGFPQVDGRGVKIAEHSIGDRVDDPAELDRELHPRDQQVIQSFAASHLPNLTDQMLDHRVCMYTTTPDHHFVVDRHPQHSQVAFAAGLSGHGFKMASVLGEVLADLALEGATRLPIEFLRATRAALSPPDRN